jgi:hypothetical protein
MLVKYLEDQTLQTKFGNITCGSVYGMKYRDNPFVMEGSAVHYLSEEFKTFVETACAKVRHISDTDIPLHTKLPAVGPVCYAEEQGFECSLRHSLLDVLDEVLKLWNQASDEIIVFPGLVFNEVGTDFSCPPLSCHVLLLGSVCGVSEQYIRRLLQTFKKDVMYVSVSHCENLAEFGHSFNYGKNILIKNGISSDVTVKVAQEFSLTVEGSGELSCVSVSVVHLDQLSELLFDIGNWRQLWAPKSCVLFDNNIPFLSFACFESLAYTYDICFTESPAFSVDKFYSILWQTAADIITNVEFLNLYESPSGWRSHCYRITYQSFDKALSKQKAIDIQETVIGKMMCVKLGVSIR